MPDMRDLDNHFAMAVTRGAAERICYTGIKDFNQLYTLDRHLAAVVQTQVTMRARDIGRPIIDFQTQGTTQDQFHNMFNRARAATR